MIEQFPLTSLATLLALATYVLAFMMVGAARRKHKVAAPAIVGDPAFERAFRAHQNVLESLPAFLPVLWLFALAVSDLWAAVLGFIWSAARLGYIFAYAADANKRGPYFMVQFGVFVILWLGAFVGIVRHYL